MLRFSTASKLLVAVSDLLNFAWETGCAFGKSDDHLCLLLRWYCGIVLRPSEFCVGHWMYARQGGAGRVGGCQKFLHFFLAPAANSVRSSFSGGLLVELWPWFKTMARPKCEFGVLWGHFL